MVTAAEATGAVVMPVTVTETVLLEAVVTAAAPGGITASWIKGETVTAPEVLEVTLKAATVGTVTA